VAQIDYQLLEKSGFMQQAQKDNFILRLGVVGGQIKAEQMLKLAELADRYGQGYVHITSRQNIEIPFIQLEDVDTVKSELAQANLRPGRCGPGVRTITACQGSAVCSNGLIDTTSLANEFESRYHDWKLPHKFKIGITGCRNNCLKAEENDLGIKGAMEPSWNSSACTYCGLCAAVCREQAITVDKHNKKLGYDETACSYCGRCVKACPTAAWSGESGFIIYLGGLLGNQVAIGQQVLPIIFSTDELHQVVEAVLSFFAKHGRPKERFRKTLERVGWNLLHQDLKKISGHTQWDKLV